MSRYHDLIARAEAGDDEADHALIVEASLGSLDCQRAMLDGLLYRPNGLVTPNIIRAEVLARMVAARGDECDKLRLATLLWMYASDVGHWQPQASDYYGEEALTIMRELSDAGYGPALTALEAMAPSFPHLWAKLDAAAPIVEVVAPFSGNDVTAVDVAPAEPTLEEFLASLPPVTRWDRIRFWLEDRWLGVRNWIDSRHWDVRFAWWGVKDWAAAKFNREGY